MAFQWKALLIELRTVSVGADLLPSDPLLARLVVQSGLSMSWVP